MDSNFYTMFGSLGKDMSSLNKIGYAFFFLGKLMMPTTVIVGAKFGQQAGAICLSLYVSFVLIAVMCALYGMYVEPYINKEKRIEKLEKKLEKLRTV